MTDEKMLMFMLKKYEQKLKEYMTEAEFATFVINIAKEAFKQELDRMEDSDFKKFCLDNFEKITE